MDSPHYCTICCKMFATPSSKRRHNLTQHGSKKRSEDDNHSIDTNDADDASTIPATVNSDNDDSSKYMDEKSESSKATESGDDSSSVTSESGDDESDQPEGVLASMVAAFVKSNLHPSTPKELQKLLNNPKQFRKLHNALKAEIHGIMEHSKDIQNDPVWKKIKATEEKLRDQV